MRIFLQKVLRCANLANPLLKHSLNSNSLICCRALCMYQSCNRFRNSKDICNGNKNNLMKHNFSVTACSSNNKEPLISSKIHKENENESFHKYMLNNPNYQSTMHRFVDFENVNVTEQEFNDIISVKSWDTESLERFHSGFIKAGIYASRTLKIPISNEMFTPLSIGFVEKCTQFDDKHLVDIFNILRIWQETAGVRAPNFVDVWKALDYACVLKRNNWDLNKTLYMYDLWFGLRLARLSQFVQKSFDKFIKKSKRLTQHNLVQLFFYLGVLRRVPNSGTLYELEFYLDKLIDKLEIKEIAIIASGFFKTQKKVSTKSIVSQVIMKVTQEHDRADVMSIGAILKFIRYCRKEEHIPLMINLLDTLTQKLDSWTLQVNIHLNLVAIESNIDHTESATRLMKQFLDAPENARLKDMEKITLLISKFKHDSKLASEACSLVASELRNPDREEEISAHNKCFLRCLSNLSQLRIFDEELISKVLNENFLNSNYETRYVMDREVAILDHMIELDFPQYKGNRLSSESFNYICKRYCTYIPNEIKNEKKLDKIHGNVMQTLGHHLPKEHWTCKYLLPFYISPDIVLNVGKNLKFQEIPQEISKRENFTGIMAAPANVQLCALVLGTKPMYSYNSHKLLGENENKIRQLEYIGYTPILIPFYEWFNIENVDQKFAYIYEKLSLAFNNKQQDIRTT